MLRAVKAAAHGSLDATVRPPRMLQPQLWSKPCLSVVVLHCSFYTHVTAERMSRNPPKPKSLGFSGGSEVSPLSWSRINEHPSCPRCRPPSGPRWVRLGRLTGATQAVLNNGWHLTPFGSALLYHRMEQFFTFYICAHVLGCVWLFICVAVTLLVCFVTKK